MTKKMIANVRAEFELARTVSGESRKSLRDDGQNYHGLANTRTMGLVYFMARPDYSGHTIYTVIRVKEEILESGVTIPVGECAAQTVGWSDTEIYENTSSFPNVVDEIENAVRNVVERKPCILFGDFPEDLIPHIDVAGNAITGNSLRRIQFYVNDAFLTLWSSNGFIARRTGGTFHTVGGGIGREKFAIDFSMAVAAKVHESRKTNPATIRIFDDVAVVEVRLKDRYVVHICPTLRVEREISPVIDSALNDNIEFFEVQTVMLKELLARLKSGDKIRFTAKDDGTGTIGITVNGNEYIRDLKGSGEGRAYRPGQLTFAVEQLERLLGDELNRKNISSKVEIRAHSGKRMDNEAATVYGFTGLIGLIMPVYK